MADSTAQHDQIKITFSWLFSQLWTVNKTYIHSRNQKHLQKHNCRESTRFKKTKKPIPLSSPPWFCKHIAWPSHLEVYYTLGRCDQFKVLVLCAHASDHIYLFQSQPHSILLLGPTHHIDCKHLTKGRGYGTREQERHSSYRAVCHSRFDLPTTEN